MKLYTAKTIKMIKDKYNFKNTKSLGQNFLMDKNIIDKIVEAAEIGSNDLVIEIGPGLGVLTSELAPKARKVIAIELDKKLIPILEETLETFTNIEIIQGDILKTDLSEVIENARRADEDLARVRIIGNLPYYITTPILMKILEEGVPVETITVMMQKEVADRVKSLPNKKTYGALSVGVQYYCEAQQVALVPKEVFWPAPKVDSAVLTLRRRAKKPVELLDEKMFFAAIKGGFGQRRKTLGNSLAGVCGISKEESIEILESVGIDPIRRAETLSLQEFADIANRLTIKLAKKESDRQ